MRKIRNAKRERNGERGISLFLVAGGMVFLLGVSALAIDVASLYVGRDEAQRAADAGALAGAKGLVDSSCVSGGAGACAASQPLAITRATSAAGQNTVGTLLVSSLPAACVSVTFPTSPTGDPLVSVRVQRTTACGNAMPTFFAKMLGFLSGDVAATATAEAYNPSGSLTGPTICAGCVKPFAMPNFDPDPLHALPLNATCATPGQGYFVDPTGAVAHPNAYPTGVVGEQWVLHYNSGPSQYYGVDTGCGSGDQRPCVSTCSSATWACGNTLSTVQGNIVGQIRQGIEDLIHATATGPNHGQDTINTGVTPYQITGGLNNPNPALRGKLTPNSDSLVTVVLYDGHNVPPGSQTVIIVGYMTMFIESVAGT